MFEIKNEFKIGKKIKLRDLFNFVGDSVVGRFCLYNDKHAAFIHKYLTESTFCLRNFLPGLYRRRVSFYKRNMLPGQYEAEYGYVEDESEGSEKGLSSLSDPQSFKSEFSNTSHDFKKPARTKHVKHIKKNIFLVDVETLHEVEVERKIKEERAPKKSNSFNSDTSTKSSSISKEVSDPDQIVKKNEKTSFFDSITQTIKNNAQKYSKLKSLATQQKVAYLLILNINIYSIFHLFVFYKFTEQRPAVGVRVKTE